MTRVERDELGYHIVNDGISDGKVELHIDYDMPEHLSLLIAHVLSMKDTYELECKIGLNQMKKSESVLTSNGGQAMVGLAQ